MARFDPLSFGFNLYQAYCGADGLMVGSITYWVEVQNASTGELLLAFVGRGFPNPLNIMASVGRLTAARYGIDQAPENLDRLFKKVSKRMASRSTPSKATCSTTYSTLTLKLSRLG